MKKLLLALTTLVVLATGVRSAENKTIYPGEELVYRVSYLNITLGTIRTLTEPYTTIDGRKAAKIKIWIDSHPNIPFVSLHSIYESWMDTTATYSYRFQANTEVDDNEWEFDKYQFDYKKRTIVMEKWRNKKKVQEKKFDIKKHYNDGSSILFAARSMLYSGKSYRIPTTIMDEVVSTIVNFQGKVEETEIDAVEYPIRTVYLNGDANWTGIYGMTGRFEGWFSDDEARIPIKAKMNLYVGAATIELQSWKRGSWKPPMMK